MTETRSKGTAKTRQVRSAAGYRAFLVSNVLALGLVLETAAAMNLPRYWWSRGVGGAGAFFSPSINPASPDTLSVSTDMGVAFRSVNGGALWDVYSWSNLLGGRLDQMQYTSDPRVQYVLDGNASIKRSTDGGQVWTAIANDPALAYDGTRKKLRSDCNRSGRLVLGQDHGLWFSDNGGTNWVKVYTNTAPGTLTCYLADTFFCGANIFAAGNFGLYVSTNHGTNFTSGALTGIGATQEIVAFTGAAANGHIRLYCITTDSTTANSLDDGYPSPAEAIYGTPSVYQGVYACDWPGGSWVMVTNGMRSIDAPAFVACATNRPDIVYTAGQASDWGWPAIYQSTNAGTNWTAIFNGHQNQNIQTGWEGNHGDLDWGYGGGVLGFAVCASNPNRILYSDWGFLHGTTNGGALWQALYVPPAERHAIGANTPTHGAYHGIGLEDTSCWWLTWLSSNTLFASFTDCGALRSTNGGAAWISAGADVNYNTIYCCVTGGMGRAYAAASSIHDLYASTHLQDSSIDGGNGAVLVTTNQASSWQVLHDFGKPVIWVALHPANNNILYASVVNSASGGIYVTSNLQAGAASTWSRLAVPPRTAGHPLSILVLRDGTLVCSYSGRISGSTFTYSSGVFVSANGGASWTDVSVPNMQCWTKDLVLYPFDSAQQTWFACVYEAWGNNRPVDAGGLYRTTNRGQSWTAFSWGSTYPLFHRVASISFHPADTNTALLTTEDEGLLVCTNILAAAPTFTAVTNYPFFQPTRVFTNPYDTNEIWTTSFGNGLRVGWLSEPAPVFDGLVVTNGTAVVAGGARDGQRFTLQATTNLTASWSDLATNAAVNLRFTNTDASAGSFNSRFYRTMLVPPVVGP